MRLEWDLNDAALTWAAQRIPYMHGEPFPDNARAGAFIDDAEKICGAVVFHDWQPAYKTIQVSAICENPRWLHARKLWAELFAYAYERCDVRKIWTMTPHENVRALRFVKALGFQPEAVLQDQFGPGLHGVFSSRFRHEQAQSA
jgi:hypothetical protein